MKLDEAKNGFGKGWMCMVCMFIISQLNERQRECNLATLFAFLGYEKAFDIAIRNKGWQVMTNKGFPRDLIRVVQTCMRILKLK
jgi:hypothetical protein